MCAAAVGGGGDRGGGGGGGDGAGGHLVRARSERVTVGVVTVSSLRLENIIGEKWRI